MVRFSVHDPFSVCFLQLFVFLSLVALRWIFAFLHMPFLFFFPSSSRRFLLILASVLTFLRVILDSLDAFYLLLSLAALSLSFQPIFTQNPLSTNLNYNNFLPLTKL